MTAAELRSRPLVFVEDLNNPILDEQDHHHLTKSLRIRPGDDIAISDGRGRWRSAKLASGSTPDEVGEVRLSEKAPAGHSIAFALVKGDRSELVVQKLTELGIGRIVPMITERTVVRWDEKRAVKNGDRHRRIAREAAMQSRNLWLPDVWVVTPISAVLEQCGNAVLAEPGGSPLSAWSASSGAETVLIGPEGGFSPAELAGRPTIGLPGNILRTETAAISAAVLLASTARRC